MAFARDQIEGQITAKMQHKGLTRQQAIGELLGDAEKGAQRAEREVTLATDAMTRAKTEVEINKLKGTIASEGRFASLERDRIAVLKEIVKEEKKQ